MLNVPLGRRAATAGIQSAEAQLARERAMMRQMVHATAHNLGDIVRQIDFSYRQYQEADARWRDNTEWLEGERFKFENPPVAAEGQDALSLALNNYLMAMQSQYIAAVDAANLLAQYNSMLVRLEEATGTLAMSFNIALEGDNVLSPRKASLLAADVYQFGIPVNAYQTSVPAKAETPVPIPAAAMPGPMTQGYATPVGVQPSPDAPTEPAPPAASAAPVAPPSAPVPVNTAPPANMPWQGSPAEVVEPPAPTPSTARRIPFVSTTRMPAAVRPPVAVPAQPPTPMAQPAAPVPQPPRPAVRSEPAIGGRFVN
jgi:hypothetical protein